MIRETTPDDWELLRDVRLRALAEAPYAFLTTYVEAAAQPDAFWRARATPDVDSTTFVAGADGRFDGMVSAFPAGGDADVVLVAMWVDPGRRGTGLATELVERVCTWARARRATRVVLTVEAGNDRARRLYERCGFRVPARPVELPYEVPADATNLERVL